MSGGVFGTNKQNKKKKNFRIILARRRTSTTRRAEGADRLPVLCPCGRSSVVVRRTTHDSGAPPPINRNDISTETTANSDDHRNHRRPSPSKDFDRDRRAPLVGPSRALDRRRRPCVSTIFSPNRCGKKSKRVGSVKK